MATLRGLMNKMIPFYLQDKLSTVGINSLEELRCHDSILVFQWLKDLNPSLGYNALYDLYCLSQGQNLNSIDAISKEQLRTRYTSYPPHYAPLAKHIIDKYMQLAMEQSTAITNEIPIGAVIVRNGEVIGQGSNQTIRKNDITQHAEIVALTAASRNLGTHRLDDCDLFVTIEPCLMCTGAIIHSHIRRVVFGASEPKTGAILSQYRVLENRVVNKHTEAIGPVDNDCCAKPLRQFLKSRR